MKKLILVALLIIVSLTVASPANASIWDDLLNKVKSVVPKLNSSLTLDSQISFAEGGDVNKNGLFDGGDTLKFSYTINNPTDKEISFANLPALPSIYLLVHFGFKQYSLADFFLISLIMG